MRHRTPVRVSFLSTGGSPVTVSPPGYTPRGSRSVTTTSSVSAEVVVSAPVEGNRTPRGDGHPEIPPALDPTWSRGPPRQGHTHPPEDYWDWSRVPPVPSPSYLASGAERRTSRTHVSRLRPPLQVGLWSQQGSHSPGTTSGGPWTVVRPALSPYLGKGIPVAPRGRGAPGWRVTSVRAEPVTQRLQA